MGEPRKVHEPGDCIDPSYGNPWCSGEATLAPNPYAEDVHGDDTPVWMCAGAREGAAADV